MRNEVLWPILKRRKLDANLSQKEIKKKKHLLKALKTGH